MPIWEKLSFESAQMIWDENLTRFDDYSPFQTYAWGEYNRAVGWSPIHLVARDESGEICAMMLGLIRRFPLSIGLLWCEGGPAGDITTWNEDLQKAISRETGIKRLYCRIRCDRERNINDALALNHQGWMRSWVIMNSAWTMEIDLNQSEEELLKNCSGNWRRNLKSAEKENLKVSLWANPEPDEIYKVFAEMQNLKDLPELFSRDELENIFKHAGANLICFRGEDENGNIVAVRTCLHVGQKACEFMGATSQRGRDLRVSYLITWKLLQECRRRGIKFYDLCGIDPFDNPGGYRFKKQTGAKPLEALGEWDTASSEWMRWFGNWAIWRKNRINKIKTVVKKLTDRKQVKLTEELVNQ
jgi:CelD/BcsL family acetyltransferase involved in cellulose biosynthesis